MSFKATWNPAESDITTSNIYQLMNRQKFDSYEKLYQWSINHRDIFWTETIDFLNINLRKRYDRVVDLSEGAEQPHWLPNAQLNIVESCFQNKEEATAIIYQNEGEEIKEVSQKELKQKVAGIANGFAEKGLKKGDSIAIDMPMTYEAVAIYLAGIQAGLIVVTIADSFVSDEIQVRLDITQPKIVFTQDVIIRNEKEISLYSRIKEVKAPDCVVISVGKKAPELRDQDCLWEEFLSEKKEFEAVIGLPEDPITILFSSGTTGNPKAIPWNHTTPIKSAADGFYHHNIHQEDVVCWPTNLGWMMGPWLVFATLINKGTIALYGGSPLGKDFGEFVQNAQVNILGVVPSLVAQWKTTACMEDLDWSAIKLFSSTGEVSNPEDMEYLMQLAGNKPIIEYCGGTETGGGYITGTVVQGAIPGVFSTPALGTEFVLLDDNNEITEKGEVFLVPPVMGLSNTLLNRDHHEVYYKDTPVIDGKLTRRHGDQMERLSNGYFRALGRVDDAMNLGGIKVSAIRIEEIINQLDFVKESAAIAVSPPEGGPSVLVIYFVPNQSDLSAGEKLQQIKRSVRERLNPLFKVANVVEIEILPRTASNKVMRRKLRDDYENRAS